MDFVSLLNYVSLYSKGSFIQERCIESLGVPGTMHLFIDVKMDDLGIISMDPITSFPPAAWFLQISWLWLINC